MTTRTPFFRILVVQPFWLLCSLFLFILLTPGFAQDDKNFQIPFPSDSDSTLHLKVDYSELDWSGGPYFIEQKFGAQFNSKKYDLKTSIPGALEIVFVYSDVEPESVSMPGWLSETYPEVIVSSQDEVLIDKYPAQQSLFMGLKTYQDLEFPEGATFAYVDKIDGFYAENFFFRIPGYPNVLKIKVSGKLFHENNDSVRAKEILNQFRREALEVIKTFSFEYNSQPLTETDSAEPSSEETEADTDPAGEEDLPWTTIIGAVSASAVALGLRKLLKKKATPSTDSTSGKPSEKKKEKEKKEEEEEAHYLLQLSSADFQLQVNVPQILEVDVYKITSKSQKRYPADIQIQCSEKALSISPVGGTTPLRVQLQLKEKPDRSNFSFTVTAQADGKTYREEVRVQTEGEMRIVFRTSPAGIESLRPDIDRLITLMAQVQDDQDKAVDSITRKLLFTPQSDWLDISDPVWSDEGWVAINLGASNPNPVSVSSHPPSRVEIQMLVEEEENVNEQLEESFSLQLLDCKLESETHQISLPIQSDPMETQFKVWIENAEGEKNWKFSWDFRIGADIEDEAPAEVHINQESDTQAQITLKGPIIPIPEGERQISKKLVISASQGDETPLETHITVIFSQVGLYVNCGAGAANELTLLADKPRKEKLQIGLFRFNPQTEEIVSDLPGLSELTIEVLNEDKATENLLSVLKPEFSRNPDGPVSSFASYFLSTEEEIPGYGETYEIKYQLSVPAGDEEDPELFKKELTLQVKTNNVGKKLKTWEEAYAECQYMIKNYVPQSHSQEKLTSLLEERKHFLDVEGLVEFRNQVGSIGAQLILAEGEEGYKDVDKWSSRILTTLEWAEWAGDICYTVLAGYFLKGPAAVAAGMIKPEIIDAINFFVHERDRGFQAYVDQQIDKLLPYLTSTLKGRVLSIDNIEALVSKNPAICWTVYVSCQFLVQLYQTKSMIEAAKNTGREIRDELLVQFLSKELGKRYPKSEGEATAEDGKSPKKAPKKSQRVQEALDKLEAEIKVDADGNITIDKSRVWEIMEDPAMVRTIKNHGSKELKEAFDRPRQETYSKHDKRLREELAAELRIDPNNLKVDDFRTPGSAGDNLNTDRDYRVLRKVKLENGNEAWVEVSHKIFKSKSERIFGELTGKPPHMSDSEWAAKKQQMPGDFTTEEASIDYSDQAIDPDTGENIVVESNILKVKKGKSVLRNPDSVGNMYQNKVNNAGNRPEKYAQAQKAIKTLESVKEGYVKQGYKLKDVNPSVERAKQIIADQPADLDMTAERMSQVDQQLKDLGYRNGFEDAIKDITGEFKDLKDLPKVKGLFSSLVN